MNAPFLLFRTAKKKLFNRGKKLRLTKQLIACCSVSDTLIYWLCVIFQFIPKKQNIFAVAHENHSSKNKIACINIEVVHLWGRLSICADQVIIMQIFSLKNHIAIDCPQKMVTATTTKTTMLPLQQQKQWQQQERKIHREQKAKQSIECRSEIKIY